MMMGAGFLRLIYLCTISICLSTAPAAAACKTLVGGVCLDKKPTALKKQSDVKKKPVKKKSVVKPVRKKPAPKTNPEAAVRQNADACVAVTATRPAGYDPENQSTYSTIIFKNKCKQAVNVYVQLNPCRLPRAYFLPFTGKGKNTFKLVAGQKAAFKIAHSETLKGVKQLARTSAVYRSGGGAGKYPRFGC